MEHSRELFNRESKRDRLPSTKKTRQPVESLGELPILREVEVAVGNLTIGTNQNGMKPKTIRK